MLPLWESGARSAAYCACMLGLAITETFGLSEHKAAFMLYASYILRLVPATHLLPSYLRSVTDQPAGDHLDSLKYRIIGLLNMTE